MLSCLAIAVGTSLIVGVSEGHRYATSLIEDYNNREQQMLSTIIELRSDLDKTKELQSQNERYIEDLTDETVEATRRATEAERSASNAQADAMRAMNDANFAREDAETAKDDAASAKIEASKKDSGSVDIKPVVDFWGKFTTEIICLYDGYTSSGSGFLSTIKDSTGEVNVIMTNKHVIDGIGVDTPTMCRSMNDDHLVVINRPVIRRSYTEDYALIYIDNPEDFPYKKVIRPQTDSCRPNYGDEILILGYPAIGSTQKLTVTKGIVSSAEDSYIVTDAKMDEGNSGGVAVLVTKDGNHCYVGIPTLAKIGVAESLGRVLYFPYAYQSL